MSFSNCSLFFDIIFSFFGQLGTVGNFFPSLSEAEKLTGSDKKIFFELSPKEKLLLQKEEKRYFIIYRR